MQQKNLVRGDTTLYFLKVKGIYRLKITKENFFRVLVLLGIYDHFMWMRNLSDK